MGSEVQDFNIFPRPVATNESTAENGPYLRIVEQAAKLQRFRYALEGISAISPLKGVNWTPERPTFPTIEVVNCSKPVLVIVSCVTKDEPHRPHPNKVVGRRDNNRTYRDGICELRLNEPPLQNSFNNFGIHIVRKKDIDESLKERRKCKVTPFDKDQRHVYNLNELRLCFQAFINPAGMSSTWQPLKPVISDLITDRPERKALLIRQICNASAKVTGGNRNILLCSKVDKHDVRVKFSEFDSQGVTKWQAYADFQPQDVHKQTAIAFNTPAYERADISAAVKVFIQLERPSDKAMSKPVEFHFLPDTVPQKESLECLMYCGQKLTPEQKVLIEYSLITLQNENRYAGVYFWGRINGILKDYYIAFGYTNDVLKDRKYYYSVDGYQWLMLPFVHSPKIFQATILCREPFVGDPSLVSTVKLDPIFQIHAANTITSEPPEQVKLKEEDRLAAIVFIITEECGVCPRGALYKLTDGRVVPNPMFRGLNDLQVENLSYYQLFRLPRKSLKENLAKRSDYNYPIDFLDSIEDVIPCNQAFTLNLQRNERLVVIKSCLWLGMTFFHKLNSRKHGFLYMGDGKKNYDLPFMY